MFCRILFVIGMIASAAAEVPRRLEVLFLGDDGHHKPLERYRVLKQALGPQGFNITFVENLTKVTRENLNQYDALIVYANHEKAAVPPAILPWVRDGGALVALHSACGCFHPSADWFDLIGGRFKSHEGHEFSPLTVDAKHEITRDLPVLKCWDETYQHTDLTADRQILQVREALNKGETGQEPWTWVRLEGEGRVFYTASGHDLRCWNEQAYQTLVKRGILWAIGAEKAKSFSEYKIPPLEIEVPQIENRAHPEIPMMALQKPLSPSDSAAHTQVPVGTKLVLFASEPMVKNPISIDWDHRGRAWVVESFGYPNDVPLEPNKGADKIKILEDNDSDGKADKMTVFAEGLRHCTTSVFVRGGVVVTDGPDIVFLKDDNGDDKADTRQVLATGLKIHDTHAATSQFLYGIDNWIYATVGYSGVEMEVSGEKHKFGSSVFRFRPDMSELEHLQNTTNNTWGLGFTEEGDVIGSTANNNPSWILSIPKSAFVGSGLEQPKTPRIDTSTAIYPITQDVTQVDQIDRFTAAAGHQFYNDAMLPAAISASTSLICEPTGHLVATGELLANGSLKKTLLRGNNLFASADAWSAPVAARSGPDGAVWVADWYDPIIQHNVVFRFYNVARNYDQPHSPYHVGEKGPGKGNAYQTPLRDREHGRIWRIVSPESLSQPTRKVDLKSVTGLVAALSSPSQLIRLQAQRLLIERGGDELVSSLKPVLAGEPLGAIHAIWVLQGIGASSGSEAHRLMTNALADSRPLVRRHAMLALGASDPAVIAALPSLVEKTSDPRERLFVLITAAQTQPNQPISNALWKLVSGPTQLDDTEQQAARLAMRRQGSTLLTWDFQALGEVTPTTWVGKELLEILARIAASPQRPALESMAATAPAGLRVHIAAVLSAAPSAAPAPVELPAHLMSGRDLYLKSCIECHQADGKGVADTFPPLAGSEWVKGSPNTFLRILLGGLAGPIEVSGIKYNSVMPGHSHMKDEELAAIASYVRHAFGETREDAISPEQVQALRPSVEKRNFSPWTVAELREIKDP